MRAFVIGFIAILATTNAASYGPIPHPDCPIDDDPFNPTHLPVPGDCTKFYKCAAGLAYPQECPAGLNWNDKAKICDWPNNANCVPKKIAITFKQINEDEGPIKHKDCPDIDDPVRPKHLPYPNDCTKFYKCSYGLAYPMNCPKGEHFGVAIDRCDWPKTAKCDPNVDPEPTTETTESTTTENTSSSSSSTETTTESTTESSTEPTTETTTETTTESTSTTTSEPLPPGIDCSDVPHGTLYPHPDDCQKFVHCDNGNGAVKRCPGILHFNPVLLVCDWPEVAGCKVKN